MNEIFTVVTNVYIVSNEVKNEEGIGEWDRINTINTDKNPEKSDPPATVMHCVCILYMLYKL